MEKENKSSEELREQAIKAYVDYGKAIKEVFNLQGDLLAAPLINTLRSGDEEKIKEFIADAKKQATQFKAMLNRLLS